MQINKLSLLKILTYLCFDVQKFCINDMHDNRLYNLNRYDKKIVHTDLSWFTQTFFGLHLVSTKGGLRAGLIRFGLARI